MIATKTASTTATTTATAAAGNTLHGKCLNSQYAKHSHECLVAHFTLSQLKFKAKFGSRKKTKHIRFHFQVGPFTEATPSKLRR